MTNISRTTILASAIAVSLSVSSVAVAGERLVDGAMGAVAGALVGGPIGLVAGGVVGATAGPAIAGSWGLKRHSGAWHRRHREASR